MKRFISFLKRPKKIKTAQQVADQFIHSERQFNYDNKNYIVDCLYCHASPGIIETVVNSLKRGGGEGKLLNLGGGTGQVSEVIRHLGFDVYNLDIEIDNEDKFNKRHDLNTDSDLPYPDDFFDYIVCQEVIEHVKNPWHVFEKTKKHLKRGGTLIVTTPNIHSKESKEVFRKSNYFKWFTPECHSYHINPLPFWEVELIAKRNGYSKINLTGNGEIFLSKSRSERDVLDRNEILIFTFRND